MPCDICHRPLFIHGGKEVCLECCCIRHLPRYEAEMVSSYRIAILNRMLSNYISRKNKYKLITYLMGYREKIASDYFQEVPVLDIYKLLAINILIKRIMKDGNPDGSKDLESIEELVDIFSKFLRICEENIFITEGLATYVYDINIPFSILESKQALSNYTRVFREEWKHIVKSYENELFMNEESAKAYLKEHENDYNKTIGSTNAIKYSPKIFIEKAFSAMVAFYAVFQKNVLFERMFNLNYLLNSSLTLENIRDIIFQFPDTVDTKLMVAGEIDDFEKRILNCVDNTDIVKKNLLLDDHNTEIFPFFVKVFGEGKEMILITPNFYKLLFILLHAVFYKELFDSEKARRGKILENTAVEKEFESNGYTYLPDIKDRKKNPSLQIDGIAYNDRIIYVCEVKSWSIKPFFDQLKVHSEIIRDLKGIVDGKKYTTKNGIAQPSDRPSLIKKIEFVKNNKNKLGIDDKERVIQGIIITSMTPIEKEYKEIKFISIDEIKNI